MASRVESSRKFSRLRMRVNCRPSGSQLGAPFSKEHEGGDRLRLQTRANYQKLPGQKVFPYG